MTTSTQEARGGYVFHEGDRIRKAREALGIKQEELADLSNLSRQSISSYERGINVSKKARRLLALSLGVTIEWLETGAFNAQNGTPDDGLSSVKIGWRSRRLSYPPIIPVVATLALAAA